MPWERKWNDRDIEVMKSLKRKGVSYNQISNLMGIPVSTIILHTRHIKRERDGSKAEMVSVDDLMSWLTPGVPFQELPLPSGIIAFLKEQSRQRR